MFFFHLSFKQVKETTAFYVDVIDYNYDCKEDELSAIIGQHALYYFTWEENQIAQNFDLSM